MKTKQLLLKILIQNKERYISGEEIAKQLNVSRTAIWKGINELKKEGHQIMSSTKKGYLYIPNDILSVEGISAFLDEKLPKVKLTVFSETDSTNKELKLAAIEGASENTVFTTHHQTATKGRFSRAYFAEAGKGAYLSILLRPNEALEDVTVYTLLTAVAVSRALEEFTKDTITIKWVNDLYLNGKKVCGILSEALTDFETHSLSFIIVGIGINVSIPQTDFPIELQAKATSLFPDGTAKVSRNQLIASVLNHFYQLLEDLPNSSYLEEYRHRSFVLGRQVSFIQRGQEYTGTAIEIGSKGELVVEMADHSRVSLSSGEISLSAIH